MEKLVKKITDDGSITFFHTGYEEHFHSLAGAKSEAVHKFILPSGLIEKSQTQKVKILDVPFGLGVNCLASLEYFRNVDIFAVEKDPDVCFILSGENLGAQTKEILESLKNKGEYSSANAGVKLKIGDAREILQKEKLSGNKFDAVFLDPFSPEKNPELWTLEFFRILYSLLEDDGVLLTYSSALPVLAGLLRAGFFAGETKAFGRRHGGTIALKKEDRIENPLNAKDVFLLNQSAGKIPYHDYHLTMEPEKIIALRKKTVKRAVQWGVVKTIKKSIRTFKRKNYSDNHSGLDKNKII